MSPRPPQIYEFRVFRYFPDSYASHVNTLPVRKQLLSLESDIEAKRIHIVAFC